MARVRCLEEWQHTAATCSLLSGSLHGAHMFQHPCRLSSHRQSVPSLQGGSSGWRHQGLVLCPPASGSLGHSSGSCRNTGPSHMHSWQRMAPSHTRTFPTGGSMDLDPNLSGGPPGQGSFPLPSRSQPPNEKMVTHTQSDTASRRTGFCPASGWYSQDQPLGVRKGGRLPNKATCARSSVFLH